TNATGDPNIPTRTQDRVSGLPNGTYFWRVKATQIVGGAVFAIDSPFSPVRTFTVVGLGPAPGTPSFTSPASPAQFHVREFFLINWTDVPGAHHYLLEADDQPNFSYPLTLTTDPMKFGTSFRAGWGNPLNVFYRIVAVPDPLVEGFNIFPPGTYFWRVRAVHGDVVGPWSAGQSFTIAPLPPTPPGLAVFHIINEPGAVSGGNSTQARVTLNMPAPPGG